MLIKMIEKNGLLIISMATASLYWYFDSLHPGQLISRFFTVFLFLCYGIFTQYLINTRKAMETALKKVHQELMLRVATLADCTNPGSPITLTLREAEASTRCTDREPADKKEPSRSC